MVDINSIKEFLKGDYGFLTILVVIILIIWLVLRLRKKKQTKKPVPGLAPQPPNKLSMPMQVSQQSRPVQQPIQQILPPKLEEDPFFDLESKDESLEGVERDTTKILSKKTATVDNDLQHEREEVEKRLLELSKTEKEIKDIVGQLKISYLKVKQQQKTYDLIRRSLVMSQRRP